jgi:hypothetical protein
VSIEYLELVDYLAIAVEVTGLTVETVTHVAKLDLADSALHAPAAGSGPRGRRCSSVIEVSPVKLATGTVMLDRIRRS